MTGNITIRRFAEFVKSQFVVNQRQGSTPGPQEDRNVEQDGGAQWFTLKYNLIRVDAVAPRFRAARLLPRRSAHGVGQGGGLS